MIRKIKYYSTIRKLINYFLGPLLFLWLSFSIYTQLKNQPDLDTSWIRIKNSVMSSGSIYLVIAFILMIVNWSIEALKWKLAIKSIQEINLFTSIKAVLSGLSFSVSTPNRMGEYLGRVLYMNEGNRLRAVSITMVSSMSQLIITLLMGSIGLAYMMTQLQESDIASAFWVRIILIGSSAAFLFLTLFYFRLSWIVRLLMKIPGSKRFGYLVNAVEHFNATLLLRLLSLSLIRFVVFGIQYYLLFRLFGVHVSWWDGFWSVSVTFLVMAIVPTIALVELGLRGEVSLKIVGLFTANGLGIGLTTASIWLINLVIPSILGSLLILSIKIFKNKNERI